MNTITVFMFCLLGVCALAAGLLVMSYNRPKPKPDLSLFKARLDEIQRERDTRQIVESWHLIIKKTNPELIEYDAVLCAAKEHDYQYREAEHLRVVEEMNKRGLQRDEELVMKHTDELTYFIETASEHFGVVDGLQDAEEGDKLLRKLQNNEL